MEISWTYYFGAKRLYKKMTKMYNILHDNDFHQNFSVDHISMFRGCHFDSDRIELTLLKETLPTFCPLTLDETDSRPFSINTWMMPSFN